MSEYKYKIVASFNLILGILQIIITLFLMVFALPKVMEMYRELGVTIPSFLPAYFIFGIVILMGIVNLFLGFKLYSKLKGVKEKYFKWGIVLLVATFILTNAFLAIGTLLVISPLYNLPLQF